MITGTVFNPTEREVEVSAKAGRRRFTAEYKRRVLQEADACSKSGEVGALLRREGLYTSHLAAWRAARSRGELAGLAPRKRGPKAKPTDPRDKRIAELERELKRSQARAERAEALVEVQKKLSQLLGLELPETNGGR
jgi:transposase-like protein